MEVPRQKRKCSKSFTEEKDVQYVPDSDETSESDTSFSTHDSGEDKDSEDAASPKKEPKKPKKSRWQVDGRASLPDLQKIPHECFVAFNFTDDKSFEHLKCYPSFGAAYPRAIYVAKTIPNRLEPCHKRPRQYANYQTSLNRYKAFYKSHQKKKKFKAMKKKGIYPSIVFRYAELLASNPDPFFSGRYDWYYTGGNLDVADNNALIHVDGSDLIVSEFVPNNVGTQKLQSKFEQIFDEDEEDQEIFEIQAAPSSKRVTFSVRKKKAISIYECKSYLKGKYFFTQNEVPFISSTFDPYESNNFITTNLNKTVALWDLKSSTKKPKQILFDAEINEDKRDQNWNCICPFARDVFAFAGLKNLTLLDARVPFSRSTHTFASLDHALEICEMFCSICPSNYENMLYAATTHKIFGLDMRYLGKEIEERFTVLRWVHMLRNPPLILKMHHREDHELIVASSPISSDLVYCENIKNAESKFTSPSMPFSPPNLQDAYENARSRGQCLNPAARIKERVNSCTTGMAFLEQDDALFTTFSSSNGDVFSQRISFAEPGLPPSKVESSFAMSLWEDEILNTPRNITLNVNRVDDLSVMSKIFRCRRLNNPEPGDAVDEPAAVRPRSRQSWNKPIKNLFNYTDALAEGLLAIWDVKPDEEISTSRAEEQTEHTKVLDWLDSTSLPCPEENDSMSQPLFDESLLEITPVIKTGTEDLALEPTPPLELSKPKLKPKRERHVPGF